MQRKFILGIGISALTSLIALANSISPSFSQSVISDTPNTSRKLNATNSQPDRVTFICKEIFDPASEENIPATVAWIPKRQGHVHFIAWKSEFFSWSPKKRCQQVTKDFQKYYDEGRLSYLSTGKRNGYPVICTAKPGENCNQDNHLFTIKPGQNAQLVLQRLLDIGEGKSGRPIYQSSGKQLHVEVQKIFDNASLVKVEGQNDSTRN